MGEADGSIMAAIMTAHIAHSSSRCGTSHIAVIIQALAPVIGPYMSRAITTIHIQETSGSSDQQHQQRGAVVPQRRLESRERAFVRRLRVWHRQIDTAKHRARQVSACAGRALSILVAGCKMARFSSVRTIRSGE